MSALLTDHNISSNPLDLYVEESAYCSIVSHVLKNASTSVVGVLLGELSEKVLACKAAFPLLHSNLINAPLLGLGFSLAEKWGKQRKLEIIGIYFGNNNNSLELLPHQQVIVSQLANNGIKNPFVCMVDTEYLKSLQCCIFLIKNDSFTPIRLKAGAEQTLHEHISKQKHHCLYDLLDHMTCLSCSPLEALLQEEKEETEKKKEPRQ